MCNGCGLSGKRVIVTRAEHQASALTQRLVVLGADVLEVPVIRFDAPADMDSVDRAVQQIGEYDWIVFTSANGVQWLMRWLGRANRDVSAMGSAKLAAIGPKTAAALRELSLQVDYVPTEYLAEVVVRQFPDDVSGKHVLIPCAKEARDELPEGLRAEGALVDIASVYQTVPETGHAEALRQRLREGSVDIVTFTSASTVHNFLALAGDAKLPASCVIACIGPITAEAVREYGMEPTVVARDYTIEGLVDALIAHFSSF